MHRGPQVYQFLLLSRVTDVKYSCFPLPLMRACTVGKNSQLYNNAYGRTIIF